MHQWMDHHQPVWTALSLNAGSFRVQVLGEHDDATPPADDLVEASTNQVLDKSPSAALHVQEAILKELTNEDVHKVEAGMTPSSHCDVLTLMSDLPR